MQLIWAEQALLPSGWAKNVSIKIHGQDIHEVEANTAPKPEYIKTGILLPAPANSHSHAFQRALAGLTEAQNPESRDNFWSWRQQMYRFLHVLDPDQIQVICALVQMEMLEAGFAANVEFHYLHHQSNGKPYEDLAELSARIVQATHETGIGLTLLPVHYQYGGTDRRALEGGQKRFGNSLERFMRLYEAASDHLGTLPEDACLAIAAHSLRAVSAEDVCTLREAFPAAPFHMHLAEQVAEISEIQGAYGVRPVEWVLDNLQPNENCCFIHCTHMEPHEITHLAKSNAVIGLCPLTEANLGDGIFPAASWMSTGGAIAIGSDSNVQIDLAGELRMLEYSQRLRDQRRVVLASPKSSNGRWLFGNASFGGARASGRHTGKIEPGRLADLLALDTSHINLYGRQGDQILDSFVFTQGTDSGIQHVWSAGRHMVQQGSHIHREKIIERYRVMLSKILPEI